jgi:hypothetical protein
MKRSILALVFCLSAAFLTTACVEDGDPITGSSGATVLAGSVFTITERTLMGNTQMKARGTVKNNGKAGWNPVWIVEGQFYADSTFTHKLGGATQKISFSLAKGEMTTWELNFTSNTIDVSDYPSFAVKNLRVVQQ